MENLFNPDWTKQAQELSFSKKTNICIQFHHSQNKRKDSLETRAKLDVLRTYVENQAILKPILLYRASKSKQTKEQGSEDCLWIYIFSFL